MMGKIASETKKGGVRSKLFWLLFSLALTPLFLIAFYAVTLQTQDRAYDRALRSHYHCLAAKDVVLALERFSFHIADAVDKRNLKTSSVDRWARVVQNKVDLLRERAHGLDGISLEEEDSLPATFQTAVVLAREAAHWIEKGNTTLARGSLQHFKEYVDGNLRTQMLSRIQEEERISQAWQQRARRISHWSLGLGFFSSWPFLYWAFRRPTDWCAD